MSPSWLAFAEVGGLIVTVIGVAIVAGKLIQRISDLERDMKTMQVKADDHEKRLIDGAVLFARIDEKLDAVKDGIARVEAGVKEQAAMLIDHIKDATRGG